MNQSRADDPLGLARPVLLKGTSKHAELFVQASKVLKLMAPELSILPETFFVDPSYSERNQDFQRIIHPDNIVESLRMALINLTLKCGCHRDVHNCNLNSTMMPVLVLARFVNVDDVPSRSSIIVYSRKIITSYGLKLLTPFCRLTNDLIDFFQHADNQHRRKIDGSCFTPPSQPWKSAHTESEVLFRMFLTECHFNLHHYLSCYIHFIKELQNHLGLGYVEVACLVYCSVQRETPLLFVETARDILSLDPTHETLASWGRGIRFGYGFYLSICQRRLF